MAFEALGTDLAVEVFGQILVAFLAVVLASKAAAVEA